MFMAGAQVVSSELTVFYFVGTYLLVFCNKRLQYHFFCSNLGHYICKTMTNNIKIPFSDIFLIDVLVNMSLLIFGSAEHPTKFTHSILGRRLLQLIS